MENNKVAKEFSKFAYDLINDATFRIEDNLENELGLILEKVERRFAEKNIELESKIDVYEKVIKFFIDESRLAMGALDSFNKFEAEKSLKEMIEIGTTCLDYTRANETQEKIQECKCENCSCEEELEVIDFEPECGFKILFLDDLSDLKDISKLIEKVSKMSGGNH